MTNHDLLAEVKKRIFNLYNSFDDQTLFFHTLNHVSQVASHVTEMCSHYGMDESNTFIVSAAAWFHDLGYITGGAVDHEIRSAEIASFYFKEKFLDPGIVQAIQQCILATTMPQKPADLLEQIICDADLYHFGTNDFFQRDRLMRKEVELRIGKIPDENWLSGTIQLLESHNFHTRYCQNLLNKKKELNLNRLKMTLRQIQ